MDVPTLTTTVVTNMYGALIGAISGGGTTNTTLFLGTPTGGTVKVINTTSAATLTTAGIWTNNPSWAAGKVGIAPVAATEQADLFDWLTVHHRPVRYRYAQKDGPYHADEDYDSFGFLLDDMPENVRRIVCANGEGGISTKDSEGLLFALVQEAGRRIAGLEARLAVVGG